MFSVSFIDWQAKYDTVEGGAATPVTPGEAPKTFTQEQVNAFIAAERKTLEAKHLKTLEDVTGNLTLTEEQKKSLEGQLQVIRQQSEGEVSLLKGEINKLKEKSSKEAKDLELARDSWRNRYTDARITNELLSAASAVGAYNPTQVVSLLRSNSELIERFDDKGKGLGEFDVRVKHAVKGDDGKTTLVSLSPEDVLKKMLEDVDNYGNLFKSNLKTGIGGSGSQNGKITVTDIESYKMNRESILGKKK